MISYLSIASVEHVFKRSGPMTSKNRSDSLIPSYSYIPLATVVCINSLAYFASRLITGGFVHYNFSLPIDGALPFVPVFSVVYILAYAQWAIGFILIARESRDFCYRVLSGEIISKLICLTLFLIIPTTMVRADITSGDVFSTLTKYIYLLDTPDNLFPSLHCHLSWLCFYSALRMKKTGKIYIYFSFIFSLLVFASTVLIKQHVAVDIFAGVLVCEIGQFIAKKTDSARVFERIGSFASKLTKSTEKKDEE